MLNTLTLASQILLDMVNYMRLDLQKATEKILSNGLGTFLFSCFV